MNDNKADIQYVADTFLIERTFQVLAEMEEGDGSLNKYAFDLGSVLGSIGNNIKQFVGSQIHGKDSGGVTRTVVNFMAPAVFFRLHPILGILSILVTAAQFFGFDLYTVYQKIMSAIMPKLRTGQPVSAEEVNQAAKSALSQVQPMAAAASDDLLAPLRALHNEGNLTKEGVGNFQAANRANPFVPSGKSPLLRMFSFLGPRRGSSLIVGILVWLVKTVLLSAGLLAVGGVAATALGVGGQGQRGQGTQTQTPAQPQGQQMQQPQMGTGVPAPTGAGNWNYKPNKGDIWVENLNGQQPHERVLQWAVESYPDLYQYHDIILRTPSFWNVVRELSSDWRPGQYQWTIPEPYKTRNEILAKFVPDVFRTIQQQRGTQ